MYHTMCALKFSGKQFIWTTKVNYN